MPASRAALSASWGVLRCVQLMVSGGVPRGLDALAAEAGALLACLASLHCVRRLLEGLPAALFGRSYGHGYTCSYGRGYGRVTA